MGVMEDAADKMITELRTTQPSRVREILEQTLAALGVREVKVNVQSAAGAVPERLGHVRGDGSVLLGDLGRRHLEEDRPVGGGESVLVVEIDLELAVGVFVIGLIDAPSEFV